MGLKTIPVSLRMPVDAWNTIKNEADSIGLSPEMHARSALCKQFKVKKP